jgi:DNA modification methylase
MKVKYKDIIVEVDKSQVLYNHKIQCMDCTKVKDIESSAICFTSPPYNVGSNQLGGNKNKVDSKYEDYNDDKSQNEWLNLVYESIKSIQPYSKYQIYNIQQLAGNKIAYIDLNHKLRNNFVDRMIWYKGEGCPAMAENVLNSRFEDIIIFATENSPNRAIKTGNFRGTVSNVFQQTSSRNKEFAQHHAATFPIELPSHIISKFTKEGDWVIDNFLGSGTTLIACESLNRHCYGIELTPAYCELSIQRYENLTNRKRIKL